MNTGIDGTSTWQVANPPASGTSHTISNLLNNTTYNWRIRANCTGSNSAYVDGPDFTTGSPTCDPPDMLMVSDITSNAATFSWEPVAGATSYTLEYKVDGGTIWTTVFQISGTSETVIGLSFSTGYNWRVRTNCSQGSSNFTDGPDFTTAGPTCETPSNLTVTNITTTQATLNWDPAAGAANYSVQYRKVGDPSWIGLGPFTGQTSILVNNLVPNTTYEWQVRTNCSFNNSQFAAGPNFMTRLIVTPCLSTVISFPYTNNFEAGLGWSNVAGDDFDWTHHTGPTNSTGTGPAAAAEGKWYGYMEVSNPNHPDKTAILNGPCLNLTSVNNPEISFQYHMLGGTNGEPGTLILEVSTDGANWDQLWSEDGNQGSSWLSGAVSLNTYTNETQLRIRFRGISGKSWQGDICLDDIEIGDPSQKCSAPTGLASTSITSTGAVLSWNAVSGARDYDLQYREVGASTWTTVSNIGGTSYTLSNLASNVQYEWQVRSNCKGGNSAYSITSFTTLSICANPVSLYPYTNGFEKELGWTNDLSHDFDWLRHTGTTPTSGTGPNAAAEGSWYAYMEVSGQNYPNKTAILNSPCFDLTGLTNPEFTFQYHMLGGSSGAPGTLLLEASTNDGLSWGVIWSESGNQGALWNPGAVSLSSFSGATGLRLRFRGISGTHWQGDICIDDLRIQSTPGSMCPPIDFMLNNPISYGGNQDQGAVYVQSTGETIVLQGNAWKAINLNYTVTPNTMLEFDFRSTAQGEIHGIGFDNDNVIGAAQTFKLYGTQNWGITNYNIQPLGLAELQHPGRELLYRRIQQTVFCSGQRWCCQRE
ncbi:MAG: fibronectin type III domain-containing protein [Bacteroidia bacterium]